jgi:hypothetical protein
MKKKKVGIIPTIRFGTLVSPGREIAPGPQIVQHNPFHCQNCGAYVNICCNVFPSSGEWKSCVYRKLNNNNVNIGKQSKMTFKTS